MSLSSKAPYQASTIKDPLTGLDIKFNGLLYYQRLKEGHIKKIVNPQLVDKRSRREKRQGKPIYDLVPGQKYCCAESKCHLEGMMCCIHGDTRNLILAGQITYAYTNVYIDGLGERVVVDYAWKHYCPACVSKSRRDQEVKDVRSVITFNEEEGLSNVNTVEIEH